MAALAPPCSLISVHGSQAPRLGRVATGVQIEGGVGPGRPFLQHPRPPLGALALLTLGANLVLCCFSVPSWKKLCWTKED